MIFVQHLLRFQICYACQRCCSMQHLLRNVADSHLRGMRIVACSMLNLWPCNIMQHHATPCNTMQHHATNIKQNVALIVKHCAANVACCTNAGKCSKFENATGVVQISLNWGYIVGSFPRYFGLTEYTHIYSQELIKTSERV